MRAAAMAASHPAWPAPTTTTSYCSVYVPLYVPWTLTLLFYVAFAIFTGAGLVF